MAGGVRQPYLSQIERTQEFRALVVRVRLVGGSGWALRTSRPTMYQRKRPVAISDVDRLRRRPLPIRGWSLLEAHRMPPSKGTIRKARATDPGYVWIRVCRRLETRALKTIRAFRKSHSSVKISLTHTPSLSHSIARVVVAGIGDARLLAVKSLRSMFGDNPSPLPRMDQAPVHLAILTNPAQLWRSEQSAVGEIYRAMAPAQAII